MINKMDAAVTEQSKVMIKFIMKKIKNLVIDSYGQFSYIENLDNVLYDIFGYKHFVSRINDCRNNRGYLALFIDFGLTDLIQITNTPHIYAALDDLVTIDHRIKELERRFKKAQKKGKKRDKDELKEYEYIKELYKNSVKKMRKELNVVPKKKQYKKKYKALKNLDGRDNINSLYWDDDDDDDIIISRVLNKAYDGFGYDDEDDYDDELAMYLNYHLGGKKKSKKKSKSSRRYINPFDDDEDEYLDFDFDDDDDEDDEEYGDLDELVDRIDILTDGYTKLVTVVEQLADTQAGINQSESYVIENYMKNMRAKDYTEGVKISPPEETFVPAPPVQMDPHLKKRVMNLERSVNTIETVLTDLAGKQDNVLEFLNSVIVDDDDDDDERIDQYNTVINMINTEDENDTDDGDYDLTREELIELVNSKASGQTGQKIATTESKIQEEEPMEAVHIGSIYIDGCDAQSIQPPQEPRTPTSPPQEAEKFSESPNVESSSSQNSQNPPTP